MDARSKPYFFWFQTDRKPGHLTAHCVRIETLEIPIDGTMDQATLTMLHRDGDPRLDMLWKHVEANKEA